MSAPPAPSHDCLSLSLSVLGLCVLYHIMCSVCVLVILWLSFISGVCLFSQRFIVILLLITIMY